ncbi:MAG: hypothetical protein ACFE0K_10570 [Alcanivorax sp.]|uniref:hypothetical protein n=1 Tax=Alcanivorax sp. TaxID=1872427 RepID=UPI003DA722DA
MWLRIIASSMLVLCTAHAQAHIRTDPNAFTTTFTWNGGDLNHSFELCVSSVQQPNPQGNTLIDYAVEAQGPFELVSGANSIPVTLSWDDLISGQTTTLQPSLSTAEIFTGAARYCPGGNNARLDVYASGTDIQAVPPGTYSSQFNFTATNSGRGKSSANFTVSVDITIPNSIQVTQIDDIALGTFDGSNNISRSDTLCVYQASGGQYAVTLTGSGNGGAFELISAGSSVPYAVSWNDGNGAQTATAGIPMAGMGNSRSGDPQCNGGASNNATVTVDVLANDIGAATASGTHSGVLTIMVEMQ